MSRVATTRVSMDMSGLSVPAKAAVGAPSVLAAPANPHAPGSTGLSPSRGFTRDQLLDLGRTGDPYRFIPLAHQALLQHPDDAGVRFLLATNYARLLLRTPAAEQLDRLPPEAQSDATTQSLRAVLAQLPNDRVSVRANNHFEANLAALDARRRNARTPLDSALPAPDALRDALAQWNLHVEVFAARSLAPAPAPAPGSSSAPQASALNFFIRPREASPIPARAPGGWAFWNGDSRAAILAVPLNLSPSSVTTSSGGGGAAPGGGSGGTGPAVVEGLSPPLLFERLYESSGQQTAKSANGYRAPIRLVQADLGEFAFALTQSDLASKLADPRVQLFLGPTAAHQLRDFLDARIDLQVLGPAYVNAGVAVPAEPHVHNVLTSIQARQQEVLTQLRQQVAQTYLSRTPAWYAQRFQLASEPAAEPLRVLIPTCRYTTFVRHSARDIADAFTALGWQSRILEEPDEFSHLAAPSYLRAYADFKPDLVILINYTRANLNQPVPPPRQPPTQNPLPEGGGRGWAELGSRSESAAHTPADPIAPLGDPSPFNVPFVCWVQDAMPHLFDERIGKAQTGFDFLAGHIHAELRTRYAYPNADVEAQSPRALSMPVVVDTTRFHPAPVDQSLRDQLHCEVAFASHHSLPPEGLHDQILSGGQIDPNIREIFERLFPLIREAVDRCASMPLHRTLRSLTEESARDVLGAAPPPVLVTRLVNNYVFPIADRMIRHDAVHWAARICRRRNWRLHLHGKGWDKHDALAEFARGELSHGEDLRASYQAAACHIHASIHWPFHQRVMECAASGGLPIYRFKHDDLDFFTAFTKSSIAASDTSRRTWPEWPEVLQVAAADHPEALARLALLQRLGEPEALSHEVAWNDDALAARRTCQGLTLDHDSVWLLGDPAEVSFRSEAELERVIEKAALRPAWRDNCSAGIRSRVLKRFTYRHAAESIFHMVRDSMTDQTHIAALSLPPGEMSSR